MIKLYYSNARSGGLAEIEKMRSGAWVHIVAPGAAELEKIAKDHKLDLDLLQDAVDLYEAPRIERDGETVYVYTRYYHSDNGVINATEPLLIVHKPDAILTVLRIDSPILNNLTNNTQPVFTTQKTKTILEILEAVNDSYRRYLNEVTRKVLSVRSQFRRTDISSEVLLGFVETEDDLNEFLSALEPQAAMLRNLLSSKYLKLYEQDKDLVEDLSLGTAEIIELVNSRLKTLASIREAYDAVAASDLNRTFRRLTSISIFLMIPTLFSSLYGMNVRLPFADSAHTFSGIMVTILIASILLLTIFRKKRWL